ncbi:MAG: IgA Peptidase M64 [Terriglobales bacterium]
MLALLIVCLIAPAAFAAPPTIRLDYYHTGNVNQEMFSFDRFVVEPLPWPGNPSRAIDDTNLGKYLFEVRDRATNRLLYSRGFASIYGEWETTDEAKALNRTFSESLRFPDPGVPAQVLLKKRDAQNNFREAWSVNYDPKDIFIGHAKPAVNPGALIEIEKHGDPSQKVDFLVLGDGYTAAERAKCEKDARRLMAILFATSPFKERRSDFNVWGLCPAAVESGISRPSSGIYRRSPAGASYDAFGSERYVLSYENKAFRELASFAPYEFVEIVANAEAYGGGGIFGLYSTVAADSQWAAYVFVHEFGHHFAALADEYYTSEVAYNPPPTRIEPWEPNVTALLDPERLKWKALVGPGTPLPTPWQKEKFESYEREIQAKRRELRQQNRPETEMDALFAAEQKHEEELFAAEKYANKIGAFEGANYEAKGYYRPQLNCIMFTRTDYFCKVCRQAVERVIDLYVK